MKYLWVFVILSMGAAFGQNAYGPDFLNLHCTAPDPFAQVLFNIPPRPGLVPDHAANGNVIFYCDAASGSFKASFSGGPYSGFAIVAGANNTVQFNSGGALSGIANTNAGLLFSPTASGPPAFQNVMTVTNPQANNDPTDRAFLRFNLTTDSTTSTPGAFTDENGLEIVQNVLNGQALYSNAGGATRGKKTFLPFAMTGNFQGSGQKILTQTNANCYSMSDCSVNSTTISYAGGPITGDEGQGFNVISSLAQQNHLNVSGVSSTSRTTCNTTTTQSLTPSATAQTFTVASSTGCNVNDWVVLGQEVATGSPQEAPMQVTAVSTGHLTGIVVGNFANGATVTPATVMNLNTPDNTLGQDRLLVDTTTTPVTAGTVSGITGAAFTGSGTSWTTGMVGGSATVIGCINLTPDDLTATPFNGSAGTANGPLHTYYPITAVSSNTALSILSWSVAQDAAYHGNGPGAGGYVIRPCAKVLRVISNSQIILETNTFTWNTNDALEEAINAYPDITGFQYNVGEYTAGGVRREFMNISNNGARSFQLGINLTGQMPAGGGADIVPFLIGYQASGANVGFVSNMPGGAGIGTYGMQIGTTGTSHGLIGINNGANSGASIGLNPTTIGLELNTTAYAPASVVQGTTSGSLVFSSTDPLTSASIPDGEYVGRLDVFTTNSLEPRYGLVGKLANTWFIQTDSSGVGRNLDFFQNQNGGAQGGGVGNVLIVSATGQVEAAQGQFLGVESAAPSFNTGAGFDNLWSDSTAHRWQMLNNGGSQDNVGDTLVQNCGTTTTCSHTNLIKPQIVSGTVALVSGTPSTATVTGISPAFTSSTSFNCTCSDNTTATNACNARGASASSVTMTGANTVTDTVSYICAGN